MGPTLETQWVARDPLRKQWPCHMSRCMVILSTQVKTSGEFKAFDYGSKNQAVYHQVGVAVLVSRTPASKPTARLTLSLSWVLWG